MAKCDRHRYHSADRQQHEQNSSHDKRQRYRGDADESAFFLFNINHVERIEECFYPAVGAPQRHHQTDGKRQTQGSARFRGNSRDLIAGTDNHDPDCFLCTTCHFVEYLSEQLHLVDERMSEDGLAILRQRLSDQRLSHFDTSSQQASYRSTLSEVQELDALIYPIQYDTSDYLRAMQGAGNGSVTVTTTRRGIFGTTTQQQTYNVPANNGVALPGTTKADYDRADKYLHALADETGGRLLQANDTTQLAEAFTRIAEELRRQYSLGYYPKTEGAEGSERRQIKVKVRQPNLAVKARDSYVKSAAGKEK